FLASGTALVYPTLIAAMSDAVSPVARAPVVGVYRFWRDTGYVAGGLIAGTVTDALGFAPGLAIVRRPPPAPPPAPAPTRPASPRPSPPPRASPPPPACGSHSTFPAPIAPGGRARCA